MSLMSLRSPASSKAYKAHHPTKNYVNKKYGNRLPKTVVTSTAQQTECIKNQLPVATDVDIDQDVKRWWVPKKTITSTPMMVNCDPRVLKSSSPVSDVDQTESKIMIMNE